MAVLINLGTGAGSTNGDTLYEAFTKINTNYSGLESVSNKSINVTTDGASDTKYPSVKAVKTYVDTNSSGLESVSNKSINVTTDGASDTKYPSVKAVKTYIDTNSSGLEIVSNKSTNVTTDGASDTKYPSVKAVKTYVDANSGGGTQIIKTLKTTITPTEVRTLNTIPKNILTNSGIEKILYPISVYIVKQTGNGYLMSSRNFAIRNQNNDDLALFDGYSISQSGVNFIQVPINLSHGLDTFYSNYNLQSDQSISGGAGNLDVYVTYVEITY